MCVLGGPALPPHAGELEAHYRRESLGQVRAHLGREQLERAQSRGMALSSDEVLDLASGKLSQVDLPGGGGVQPAGFDGRRWQW